MGRQKVNGGGTSRRRFIAITAAAVGLEAIPWGVNAAIEEGSATWRGIVLGALATMRVRHRNRAEAERLIRLSLSEARRLERLFSLYRADSVLVELNRRGALAAPPAELVALLEECRRFAEMSAGAFDPTVQPLWRLYSDHFATEAADPAGPPEERVAEVLRRIGLRHVQFSSDRVVFGRLGMALTFNGIAQGYITDRIVDLLHAHGIESSLVNMGETRAIGSGPDGSPWRIGIADPADTTRVLATLPLTDRAVATSGGYGFQFDSEGRFNHLFDPATGGCARRYRSVTVVTTTATAADALSTAFALMPLAQIRAVLARQGDTRVHVLPLDGERIVLGG